jgi:hypothetical protein
MKREGLFRTGAGWRDDLPTVPEIIAFSIKQQEFFICGPFECSQTRCSEQSSPCGVKGELA